MKFKKLVRYICGMISAMSVLWQIFFVIEMKKSGMLMYSSTWVDVMTILSVDALFFLSTAGFIFLSIIIAHNGKDIIIK